MSNRKVPIVNIPKALGKNNTKMEITVATEHDLRFVQIIDSLVGDDLSAEEAKILLMHIEDRYALAITEKRISAGGFSFSDAFRNAFGLEIGTPRSQDQAQRHFAVSSDFDISGLDRDEAMAIGFPESLYQSARRRRNEISEDD